MHPELFLLLYQQRERQLEQLHARRAAAVERFESTPTPRGCQPLGRSAAGTPSRRH